MSKADVLTLLFDEIGSQIQKTANERDEARRVAREQYQRAERWRATALHQASLAAKFLYRTEAAEQRVKELEEKLNHLEGDYESLREYAGLDDIYD